MQSRWKSPVLWSSAVGQIVSLLILLKVIDTGLGDTINMVTAGVLQLLTLFGLINNPENPTGL